MSPLDAVLWICPALVSFVRRNPGGLKALFGNYPKAPKDEMTLLEESDYLAWLQKAESEEREALYEALKALLSSTLPSG